MEGMESVYLKGKPVSWCSEEVTFKQHFSKFSEQLQGVFPSTRTATKDISHGILQEAELSNESLKNLTELTDPNNFRRKIGNGNISEEISQPSTSRENMPSTSKESNQSTSGEGIPSTSKQQVKAASRDLVEAMIVSSSQEESTYVPAREIGQGPIKNQNTEVNKKEKKRDVKKSDIKEQNNIVHVQHGAVAEKSASDLDKRSTTKIKTYGRSKNVKKGFDKMQNNEVQNQQYTTLSAQSPNKIPKIKTCQMQGNVQREINKEVKGNLTSSKEVNEVMSQLLTNLLPERIVPGPSTPKENNRSTSGEGILSTSKQEGKAASRNWVEAVIQSSSEEETEKVPVREMGQGSIKNKNNAAKKKPIINKSDNVGQNNHVHVQHNAAAETTDLDPVERSTTKIKSIVNRVKVREMGQGSIKNKNNAAKKKPIINKSDNVGQNNHVHVQHNAAAETTDLDPVERSTTKIKTSVNRVKNNEVQNGAINEEVQVPQNTTSEAVEIVSQLLESMLFNLNSDSGLLIGNPQTPTECVDLQSKTNVEIAVMVDCLSTEESLTNTGNTSLDIATTSLVDHKENMATTPGNPDIFKVSSRRSTRRKIKKKQVGEVCINKCKVQESEELQNASNCNDTSKSTEGVEGSCEPRYFGDIMREITKRGGRNRRRNRSIRGQILVDTTKRLGKKDLVPRKHFVVTFRIHKPFYQNMGQRGVRPGKCLQEIEVLSYQTLADLRKKIMCEADYQDTAGNVSSWPYTPVTDIAKKVYKSAMFYFNNTFYVDTREGSEDYSVVVRKWAEEHFIKVGETKPMEEMKVEDLKMRFGYPYVFIHQGSCEHLIIISCARLLTEKMSLHSSDYPNLTKTTQSTLLYCATCTTEAARWVVIGSDQMIQDTNLMCDPCFHNFHYVGTKKVGNFKAYHYRQRAILYH